MLRHPAERARAVIVIASFSMATNVLAEASLSFLGLGVPLSIHRGAPCSPTPATTSGTPGGWPPFGLALMLTVRRSTSSVIGSATASIPPRYDPQLRLANRRAVSALPGA